MKQQSNVIPGWRQPTAQERAWIEAEWGYEFNLKMNKKSGKLLRYIGIFLIVTGVASATRQDFDVAGLVVTMILAAICLVCSAANRKNAHRKDNRLEALAKGSYLVAPAQSVEISYGRNQSFRSGMVKVCLPDGQPLEGVYKIPYRCAEPLLRQKIHNVPLLLIQIPGESGILAIPAK